MYKPPERLTLDYRLRTGNAAIELIGQEAGVNVSMRTVGDYLKRRLIRRSGRSSDVPTLGIGFTRRAPP